MIGKQCDIRDILAVLCKSIGAGEDEQQVAFFLREHDRWKLAATGDLTAQSSAALAEVAPLLVSHQYSREADQIHYLYSEVGELLGVLVILANPAVPAPDWTEKVEYLCRLAILSLEQRNLLDELLWQADHDSLTGLFSRTYFERLMSWTVEHCHSPAQVALVCLNLDRFRLINEVLGHTVGNRVIEAVGRRLQHCAGSTTSLARLGGDEFAVLVPAPEAIDVANRMLNTLRDPVIVDESELCVQASIGISYASAGDWTENLQREAQIALREAKQRGRNRWIVFDQEIEAIRPERLAMELRLRAAIARGEISLQYQPQVELATGRIRGVEALLRWNPEGLGSVAPAIFIPILEETGLILEYGNWVLQEACRQGARWRAQSPHPFTIAVNVAAQQFASPDFPAQVEQILSETGLPPELLELELTESNFVRNFEQARSTFQYLQSKGISIAMDDFGVGQISLSYLHELPFQRLKIDRSFVREITSDRTSHPILGNLVRLGTDLGMTTLAEGIDRPEQVAILRRLGCIEGQGFLFSKPLHADMVPAAIESSNEPPVDHSSESLVMHA